MSNQQKHSNLPKRRRKKRNPFFAKRMLTIAAFVTVAIVVAILFYFDANRSSKTNEQGRSATSADSEPELDTPESLLEKGSTKDMLAFIDNNNKIDSRLPAVLLSEQLSGQFSVYQELEKRSKELNDEQQIQVKNGLLLILTLALETLEHDEFAGTDLETEIIDTATRLSNDDNAEVAKAALYTLCVLRLREAYDDKSDVADLATAQETIQNLIRRFPEAPKPILSLFALILQHTKEPKDTETTEKIMEAIKPYYRNCKVNSIRAGGNSLEGRLLLFQHQIIDFEGKLKIRYKNDLDNLTDRIDNFLAEDFAMSEVTINYLISAGIGLEHGKRYDKARYVLEKSLERLGNTEEFDLPRQAILNSLTRINVKGQVLDLPDHTKTEHAIVLFFGNDKGSLNAIQNVQNTQAITSNRLFEVILVTDVAPINKIQKHLDLSGWRHYTLVQDPKRESVYFQAYPVFRRPSTLILDQTGKVIDVDPSLSDVNLLNRSLRDKISD